MRERLFPRWCTALFALLPMSELLYLPADGQSVYAAALACTVCTGRYRSGKAVRPGSAFSSCTMGARLDLAVSAAGIHRPHEHFPCRRPCSLDAHAAAQLCY
ncbi:MAG: hypothetical protein ACLT4C_03345 [Butyricicoccus sp.]